MNSFARWSLLIAMSAVFGAAAQEEDYVPPEGMPPQDQLQPREQKPPQFQEKRPIYPNPGGEQQIPQGQPMVERWLEKLKHENPAEYERMRRLRDENLPAFREEMRNKFKNELLMRLQREHPALYESLMNGPEHDREWLLDRLLRPNPQGNVQPKNDLGGPRAPPPDENEEKVRQLAQNYRAATDPAEKDKIRAEIRSELNKSFDLRMQHRQAEVEGFEKRIAEMRTNLDARNANRKAIVDRRLKELTEGENLAW